VRRPDPRVPTWIDGAWESSGSSSRIATETWAHNGTGIFDTIAVRDRLALDVDAHLDRFEGAAKRFGIAMPDREVWRIAVERIADAIADARGWVKVISFRDGPRAAFGGSVAVADVGRPCTAAVLPWRRHSADPLVGVKTTSWAAASLGLDEARRRGADEGIWTNQRGHVTEACAANLFVVRGRKLFTASPRDGIVAGIVRAHVLASARERGFAVHEGKVRLRRLLEADEIFLTSSVREVRAVVAVDGRRVGTGKVGAVTGRFAADVASRRVAREPEARPAVDAAPSRR